MKQTQQKRNKGISLVLTLGMALYGMSGQPGRRGIIIVGLGMVASLCYAFSDWPKKKGLSVAERMGRWAALGLVACTTCGAYVYQFWPKQKVIIHVVQFHPKYGVLNALPTFPGRRAWVDVDTEAKPEQAWRVTALGDVKIIPFPAYRAAADAESEIFSGIASNPAFTQMPLQLTEQPNVKYVDHVISLQEISQADLDGLVAGNLAMLVGGIIKYKDQNGCVYKTEFCGYWRGGGFNEMNPCPGGHNSEGIRTGDECTP
jgi:hypothetical protein